MSNYIYSVVEIMDGNPEDSEADELIGYGVVCTTVQADGTVNGWRMRPEVFGVRSEAWTMADKLQSVTPT